MNLDLCWGFSSYNFEIYLFSVLSNYWSRCTWEPCKSETMQVRNACSSCYAIIVVWVVRVSVVLPVSLSVSLQCLYSIWLNVLWREWSWLNCRQALMDRHTFIVGCSVIMVGVFLIGDPSSAERVHQWDPPWGDVGHTSNLTQKRDVTCFHTNS